MLYLHVGLCVASVSGTQESQEGFKFPETEATGSYRPLNGC